MNVILFSASLRGFRPVWFLWTTMLFFLLFVFSFLPTIKEELCFVRSVRGLKIFAIIQCIMLVGHVYAFATQLLPYYMGHYVSLKAMLKSLVRPQTYITSVRHLALMAFGLSMVTLIFHLATMIRFSTTGLYQILPKILESYMFIIR